MARLTTVTKARKSPGKCGRCGEVIKQGESYYWWSNMVGSRGVKKVRCQKHKPRPSEMCGSDKLSRLMAAREAVEDILGGSPEDFDSFKSDVVQALNDAAQEVRDVGEEYGESFDNMPEGLQQGDTGQRCEEMRDNCEGWADEIESAASEVEGLETPEPPDDLPEGEKPDLDVQEIIDLAETAIDVIEV